MITLSSYLGRPQVLQKSLLLAGRIEETGFGILAAYSPKLSSTAPLCAGNHSHTVMIPIPGAARYLAPN